MAETKNYTPQQVRAKLAATIKEQLSKFEVQVQELKSRELQPKEGRLAKHELCPLCGGPDRNGVCACLKLQKNAVQGYAGDPQSGGTQPMGMAEKQLSKDQMPSSSAAAAAPAAPRPQTSVAQANHEMGGFKSLAHSPTGPGARVAPMSAKKFNIGAAGRPGNPATATAAGTIQAKAEMAPGYSKKVGASTNDKAGPTQSKSYAHKTGIGVHAVGDSSMSLQPHDDVASTYDSHPFKKDEKEMASPTVAVEKPVAGAKLPKAGKEISAKGSGGQIKAGKSLAKAAQAMAKPAEGAGVGGKQMPGMGGGDAAKMPAAKPMNGKLPPPKGSASPAAKAPDPLRRAGSAEVGRMIGDKGAAAAAAKAPLPSTDVDVSEFDKGPNRLAPNKGASDPTAGMKQMVHPSVAAARAKANPNGGENALQNVRGDLNLAADKKAGGVGFLRNLISKFSRQPSVSMQPTGKGMAPAPGVSVEQAVRQLGGNNGNVTRPTDSSGGVHTAPAGQQGLASSKRFHGALPLQRAEMSPAYAQKVGVGTEGKGKSNHGQTTISQAVMGETNGYSDSVARKRAVKSPPMKKGELALSKMGVCAMCKNAEHAGMCKSVSGVNHSRTMLAVKPSRGKKIR